MAKHKSQRALYEILVKQRREGGPLDQAAKPAPIVRRPPVAETPAATPPVPIIRREAPPTIMRPATPQAPAVIAGAPLTYFHLALAAIAVVGLCVLFYFLGGLFKGESGLPVTQKEPTMAKTREGQVTPGLIVPGIERPGPSGIVGQQPGGRQPGPAPGGAERPGGILGRPAPGGAETPSGLKPGPTPGGAKKPVGAGKTSGPEPTPGEPETPGPLVGPTPGGEEKATLPPGPRYRIRIATFDIGQPNAVDRLRDFFQKDGIETEDVPGRGAHILYSLEKFADRKKADELLAKIKKELEAFEKQTHRRTSKDAYVEQVKE
jgi:hypothetical protein